MTDSRITYLDAYKAAIRAKNAERAVSTAPWSEPDCEQAKSVVTELTEEQRNSFIYFAIGARPSLVIRYAQSIAEREVDAEAGPPAPHDDDCGDPACPAVPTELEAQA